MIFSRQGQAWRGPARHGTAWQHVPQYGNWDNFSGEAWQGAAGPGLARLGNAKRLPVGGITGHFRQ